METHGYYQHGEGFLTVNSKADLEAFDANIPPVLDPPFQLGASDTSNAAVLAPHPLA